MLTVASLLAAMTIAGAFWVGVLAARRLRDWGEGRRALEDGGRRPLALAAASGAPPDDARTRRVRELVAQRLAQHRHRAAVNPARQRAAPDADPVNAADLDLGSLRVGDVAVIETGDADSDGDYIVEGLMHLREGGTTTVVANAVDGERHRWLVGSRGAESWLFVTPVSGHGLTGEPPRNIHRPRGDYALTRRGQASVAGTGRTSRPDLPRAATYVYSASARDVLWLERWDHEIVMGEGSLIDPASVEFLPGS